jgi:N-acetylmuramoyl-L-alanine amidase
MKRNQAIRRSARRPITKRGEQTMFSATVLALIVAGLLMGFNLFTVRAEPEQQPAATPEIQIKAPVQAAPTVGAVSADGLPASRVRYSGLVGIVAGHKGYDPGAVCADGLTEAIVNDVIAREVVHLLERQGVQADLLQEFDERLTEYQADALVSIHSDSCNIPGASGFKVARVTDSAIPEAEDLLVSCLNQEYAAYTGLFQHPSSITDGMTNYHAFSEIAPYTPGAIIETGFLLDDRYLLQSRPKVVARGIAAGILCFLGRSNSTP